MSFFFYVFSKYVSSGTDVITGLLKNANRFSCLFPFTQIALPFSAVEIKEHFPAMCQPLLCLFLPDACISENRK